LGWLGYYIGKSSHVREVGFQLSDSDFNVEGINNSIKSFCAGVSRSTSIQKISFDSMNLSQEGGIFSTLSPLLQNNDNLARVEIAHCSLGEDGLLSTALGSSKTKSLKHVSLANNDKWVAGSNQLVNIIVALSTHSQLEKLELENSYIGRNESMAIASLLRCTAAKLHTLNLSDSSIYDGAAEILADALPTNKSLRTLDLKYNDIGNEGVDAIARAIANGSSELRVLNLSYNESMTIYGWKSIAAALSESKGSSLEELYLIGNNIGNTGAIIFAKALANNSTLKTLGLAENAITEEGWSAFSKLLCDTSSMNRTFLSNHTLNCCSDRGGTPRRTLMRISNDASWYLALNNNGRIDEKQIAMVKILKHHLDDGFDMKSLFEWNLKVLIHVIGWFERAADSDYCIKNYGSQIGRMKLSCMHQFIRGFPLVCIKASRMREDDVCIMDM